LKLKIEKSKQLKRYVCLPTIYYLLGMSCHLGQAVTIALLCKEEITIKFLAMESEIQKASRII